MTDKIWRKWDAQKILTFNGLSEEVQAELLNLGYAPAIDIFWQDGNLAFNLDVFSHLANES